MSSIKKNKMLYRLAIDMGTSSIGWCLLRLNESSEPIAIIRQGVRIFSDGRNPKDGSSLAVTRRLARQARRRRDRLLKRKVRLQEALVRLEFFPEDIAARKKLVSLNPYLLRAEGLDRPLSAAEFARAVFHLNQRRGFLSNRKTDASVSDSGPMKQAISQLQATLSEGSFRTLGEWLYKRQCEGSGVRARLRGNKASEKAYDFYIDRSMIEQEFDALWEKQASFNPTLFNQSAYEELKDILLFQRKLRPVKPGKCTLIPKEERAPKALPSVQRFRIYQEVNNLRIVDGEMTETPLTLEQRNLLVFALERGDVTFVKMKQLLKLPATLTFNLADIKRDRLKGNATGKLLSKKNLFGKQWHAFDEVFQETLVSKLLNEPSEALLIEWLTKEAGVSEATAAAISGTTLPEGYGNLSVLAIQKISPILNEKVVPYSEAVKLAGFDSHSQLALTQSTGEIFQELPYYGKALERHVAFGSGDPNDIDEIRYGKIANPTVHIGLNELRKVVNSLIKRYGPPQQVVIEMARELKLSKKRVLEINKDQKKRQDLNQKRIEDACEVLRLNPETLDKSKRRELAQKIQLWEELNLADAAARACPYTGEPISIGRLLSPEVEIEHILPRSRTLDDSLNNKTVAMRSANRIKSGLTPYEAFGTNKHEGFNYSEILLRASNMPTAKKRRFAPDGYEWWLKEDKDFIARALNDTAYVSRIAKEYLSLICPFNQVWAVPGRLTALLRGNFGLNRLLSGNDSKNRHDHRHHALDAAVIGVLDRSLLQKVSRASAKAESLQSSKLVKDLPLPWPTYIEQVKRALSHIYISFRPEHGYQGAMHEATAWGVTQEGATRAHEYDESWNRKPKKPVNKDSLIWMSGDVQKDRHGVDEHGNALPYKGYQGGSNHCVEVYADDNGKWGFEIITTFDAYQIVRKMGEVAGVNQLRHQRRTQSGKPLIMRLMKNDLVKIESKEGEQILRVVKFNRAGQVSFAPQYEANVDARDKDKNDPFSYIRKNINPLRLMKARKISVSEMGLIKDPGFKES